MWDPQQLRKKYQKEDSCRCLEEPAPIMALPSRMSVINLGLNQFPVILTDRSEWWRKKNHAFLMCSPVFELKYSWKTIFYTKNMLSYNVRAFNHLSVDTFETFSSTVLVWSNFCRPQLFVIRSGIIRWLTHIYSMRFLWAKQCLDVTRMWAIYFHNTILAFQGCRTCALGGWWVSI